MTRGEHVLILQAIQHAATLWAEGNVSLAEDWAACAWHIAGNHEFVDNPRRAP